MPDTDKVISVAREKSGTISRPGNGNTFRITCLVLASLVEFRTKLINEFLVFKIPNLDGRSSSSNEPVAVRRESKSVDNITSFKGVKVLGVIQIPKHNNTILASRSAKRTIRRNSDSVDIAIVTDKVGAQLELGQIPDLDNLVPTTRNDNRVGRVRRETNTRNPVRVTIFSKLILAFTKSVPQLDALVTRTRDNLTVVSRERDRENITSVTNEATSGGTSVQVPKTKSLIPRSGKSELTIRRDSKVLNKVVVTQQGLARNTIVHFVTSKVPDNNGLVYMFLQLVIHYYTYKNGTFTYHAKRTKPYQGLQRWWQ